jgi:hypothetical protein
MESLARPKTLVEVASNCRSFDELSFRLADFLHEFSARPDLAMLTEAPPLLGDAIQFGDVADAYLAATAEALSTSLGKGRPEWTEAPERYLRRPWFARSGASMRACLLLESPAAFRERNLFVTANALSVA